MYPFVMTPQPGPFTDEDHEMYLKTLKMVVSGPLS